MSTSSMSKNTPAKLKVGLIGLGAVADVHLSSYQNSALVEVVAGAEPREDRLSELSSTYGFRGYRDYRRMLDSEKLDIDCVFSLLSPHPNIVTECAEQGCHVLCEKPIAIDLIAAQNMVDICAERAVKLCYGASYRFLPTLIKARELIQDGAIGEVLIMSESVVGGRGPDKVQALSATHYPEGGPGGSGMGLADHGIHLIDTFSWLTGSDIVSVFGRGNITGQALASEYLHMNFANGGIGQLLYNQGTFSSNLPREGTFSAGAEWSASSFTPPGHWQAHPGSIHVNGTKGALRIFHYANELYLIGENDTRKMEVLNQPAPAQFCLQIEAFAQSIITDTPPPSSGEDGLKALQILMM